MNTTIDEMVKAYSCKPRIQAYDITATFGEGQRGRIERRLLDENGKFWLDEQAWDAGEVAYQSLKQLYPVGITSKEFSDVASEFYSLVCDEIYPEVLGLAEAGKLVVKPTGVEGIKAAWAEYGWSERVMFAFEFIDDLKATGAPFINPLNTVLPLVLLKRLDDAVIAEFMDGRGLSTAMLEVASLRDRLEPPRHVQMAIQKVQGKVDSFVQARRKGADAIHAEHRSMKVDVFAWLDSQPKFKSIESAAKAITKQQPIAHGTGRDWYKEWKKLRSASTP